MGQPPTQPLNYMGAGPPPQQPAPGRFGRGVFGWVLFIGLAVMLFLLMNKRGSAFRAIALSEFVGALEAKQIASIEGADEVRGRFATPRRMPDGTTVTHFVTQLPPGMGGNWAFVQYLLNASEGAAEVRVNNPNNYVVNILLPLIPWLLIFGFIWFFVFRQLRRAGQVGQAGAAAQPTQVLVSGPGRWVPDPPQEAPQA